MKSKILKIIRKSFLRKIFLDFSVKINNASYSWIKKFLIAPGEKHPKHRIVNYNKFFLENVSAGDTILDVGSFGGETCFALASKAKRIIGIELEKRSVDDANKNNKFSNVSFVHGDATSFDFLSLGINKFDKVILSNVLEHIKDRVDFLKKISAITDIILLRVPMLTRDWLTVYKKEQGYDYFLDPDHKIEFTDEDLVEELAMAGWKINYKSVQFGETWAVLKK